MAPAIMDIGAGNSAEMSGGETAEAGVRAATDPYAGFLAGRGGRPDGARQPSVQALPLSVNEVGFGLLPEWLPLKPKLADAPGASEVL